MHCVLLSSLSSQGYWRLHRSVEVLGYHRDEVRILLALYLENLAPSGTENYFGMMHRGNVECQLIPAWPLPRHPDEARAHIKEEDCVLRQLYQPAFTCEGDSLIQQQGLSKWDTWHSTDKRRVITKPTRENNWGLMRPADNVREDADTWVPFTTWTIGPFRDSGYYMLACILSFRGETYHEMVDREPPFTVDGPIRLLSRIKSEDLLRLHPSDRSRWAQKLRQFDHPLSLIGDEYDVIILSSPLAQAVNTSAMIGVTSAPRQPLLADRFITSDQRFSMVLNYAMPVPSQPAVESLARI